MEGAQLSVKCSLELLLRQAEVSREEARAALSNGDRSNLGALGGRCFAGIKDEE